MDLDKIIQKSTDLGVELMSMEATLLDLIDLMRAYQENLKVEMDKANMAKEVVHA